MATAGLRCHNHNTVRMREEREDKHDKTDGENERVGHTR